MTRLLWDASALAKVYASEIGSPAASALRSGVSPHRMATTFVCYAEALSVLVRKRNRRELSAQSFQTAISALRNDIMDTPAFQLIAVHDADFAAGTLYVLAQHLNATDAALLSVFLRFAHTSAREGDECILISSDRRFLRAAGDARLPTLNPETVLPDEIAALLD